MPYNPQIHSTQIISQLHKDMLRELASVPPKTSLQAYMEYLIEEAHKKKFSEPEKKS